MDQEGVERVFGEDGIIVRTLKKTYKLDEKKIKEFESPLKDKWEDALKVDGIALNRISGHYCRLKPEEKLKKCKVVDKESKVLSICKKGRLN